MENNNQEFLKKYNELINQLIEFFPNKETLDNSLDESKIINLGNEFYNIIHDNKIYKRYLLERKNKLFQIEKKLLIPDAHIHKLLNSLDIDNQSIVWEYLQLFYIILDKEDDKSYVNKLANAITKSHNKNSSSNSTNITADDILNDIKSSISNTQDGGNIINNILETSQKIAGKYKDKLASGEITFKDMIGSLKNSAGIDNNVSEMLDKMVDKDGNLNMDEVLNNDVMKNVPGMDNIQGLLGGIMGGDSSKNDNLFSNIMGSMFKGNNTSNEPVSELTEEQIKELNDFYSNMDTNELSKIMSNLENK
jgi:hypothetical protein